MGSPYEHDRIPEDDEMHQEEDYSGSPVQEDINQGPNVPERQPLDGSQATPEPSSMVTTRSKKRQRRSKNSPEPDYSAIVQEQMSTTNRTGQACDRCKGRKMKCDSNPTGCANCIATDAVCTQTDPITKVSSVRGEVEFLRRENHTLRQQNEQLERALRESNARLQQYEGMGGNGQVGPMGIGQLSQQFPFPQAPPPYAGGNGTTEARRQEQLPAAFQPSGNHYESMQPSQTFGGAPAVTDSFGRGLVTLPPRPQPSQQNAYNTAYNVPQNGSINYTAPIPGDHGSTSSVPSQQAQGNQHQQGQRRQSIQNTGRQRRGNRNYPQDQDFSSEERQ